MHQVGALSSSTIESTPLLIRESALLQRTKSLDLFGARNHFLELSEFIGFRRNVHVIYYGLFVWLGKARE